MGRSACTVAMQHALTESLLVTMEEWAAKQPAALPDGSGGAHLRAAGSERLVLGAAAASSQRQEEPVLHGKHPSQRT